MRHVMKNKFNIHRLKKKCIITMKKNNVKNYNWEMN